MKKEISTLTAVLLIAFANAQCTPDGSNAEGLRPASSAVPCALQGQSFSQTYSIGFWSQMTFLGTTYPVNSWRIDNIDNLPNGLSSNTSPSQTYAGGSQACFIISGATTDGCGQYFMKIYCTPNITGIGNMPKMELSWAADSGVINGYTRPFIRVSVGGFGCPAVNEQQANDYVSYNNCFAISPVVSTNAATNITGTSVKLNGTVNPQGSLVNVSFDWGLSTAYNKNNAASPSTLNGSSVTQVEASLFGLISNTTYYYRTKVTYVGGGPAYGSNEQFYTVPVSGIDNTIADFVKIYPNPSNNELTIETGTDEPRAVSLVNLLGEKVITTNTAGTQTKLNTENLEEGVYTLIIQAAQHIKSSRIIVMHNSN